MRIVRPVLDPQREIDLTDQLVSAIAEELWRRFGGNDQLNWIEAERHLQQIVGQARAEARETRLNSTRPTVAEAADVRRPTAWRHRSEPLEPSIADRKVRRPIKSGSPERQDADALQRAESANAAQQQTAAYIGN